MIASSFLSKAQTIIDPAEDCSNLFFSELTFGKNPNGNLFDLNYAVEIFNPTQSNINLSNYSLELSNGFNSLTIIPLNGTIAAGDVYVICNSNADLNLQSLSDQLVSSLDFGNNVKLDLTHNNNVIDRIGQTGNPTSGGIDFVQLLEDPYAYLSTFHLDLNDYQNIDIRRGMFVRQGNPTFSSATDIIGNWSYKFNSDRTNIGQHSSNCNRPEGITQIAFHQYQPDHTDISSCGWGLGPALPVGDYFVIDHVGTDPGDITFTETAGGTASVSGYNNLADLNWNLCPNCTNSTTFNSPDGSNATFGEGVNASGSYFIDKTAAFYLSSTVYDVDPARDIHWVKLIACWPTGVADHTSKNGIIIYPTISSNTVNIKTKEKCQFNLVSTNGTIIKQGIIESETYSLDITNLATGPYFIVFNNEKGQKFYNTIIKN